MDRRRFLIEALKKSGQIALASTAVYSASTFVKDILPDASMVAGAKAGCYWQTVFAGNESACPTVIPPPPYGECGGEGATWNGCTSPRSPFGSPGVIEDWYCSCN